MIIQSGFDLEKIQRKIENEVSYMTPIFADQHHHPRINELSSLHILFDDSEYACIPFKHPDGIPMSIDLTKAKKIVTLYKREMLHAFPDIDQTKIEDVASILHLSSSNVKDIREYYTPYIKRTLQQFKFKNLHLSVPLVAWMEYAHNLLGYIREKYTMQTPNAYNFINNTVIPTLTTIERAGLHINLPLFETYFGENAKRYTKNWMIHSEYNPYTSTGRPSNKYGGINFAALNKSDGSRKIFDSRYGDDGILIQFDYDAFHLRLIANQINYPLPSTSVHKYLAQQYYNSKDITPEQYELAKQKTFALMYGVSDDVGDIPFFRKIRNYSLHLWEIYEELGFVVGNNDKKIIIENPTANKVFNYSVQWLETSVAIARIADVCDFLRGAFSKPILYTYDALLIDLHRSEAPFLPRIRQLLEAGSYRTKVYKGKTYNEMTEIFTIDQI